MHASAKNDTRYDWPYRIYVRSPLCLDFLPRGLVARSHDTLVECVALFALSQPLLCGLFNVGKFILPDFIKLGQLDALMVKVMIQLSKMSFLSPGGRWTWPVSG